MFCSVSLFSSAPAVVSGYSCAGARNLSATQRSMSRCVSRMAAEDVPGEPAAHGAGLLIAAAPSSEPLLQRVKDFVLQGGKESAIPADIAGLLGITDGTVEYRVKLRGFRDAKDQPIHIFYVGTESNAYLMLAERAADGKFVVDWRTDITGKLISTVVSEPSRNRSVSNSTYADLFQEQLKYWDKLVASSTSRASDGGGS